MLRLPSVNWHSACVGAGPVPARLPVGQMPEPPLGGMSARKERRSGVRAGTGPAPTVGGFRACETYILSPLEKVRSRQRTSRMVLPSHVGERLRVGELGSGMGQGVG
jgi:hypothetical protein